MEKYQVNIWVFIGVIILVWLFTASCVTNDKRTDDSVGRRDMALIGQLEAQLNEFDRRIERIEKTSSDISSDIDRLRELFIEYTRYVQQLRSTITNYKNKFGEETSASEKANYDPYDISDLFLKCEDNHNNSKV